MAKTKVQITITMSPAALERLDYIANQIKPRPNRSSLIDSILTGEVQLDDYPIPENIKREILRAIQRPYQR